MLSCSGTGWDLLFMGVGRWERHEDIGCWGNPHYSSGHDRLSQLRISSVDHKVRGDTHRLSLVLGLCCQWGSPRPAISDLRQVSPLHGPLPPPPPSPSQASRGDDDDDERGERQWPHQHELLAALDQRWHLGHDAAPRRAHLFGRGHCERDERPPPSSAAKRTFMPWLRPREDPSPCHVGSTAMRQPTP